MEDLEDCFSQGLSNRVPIGLGHRSISFIFGMVVVILSFCGEAVGEIWSLMIRDTFGIVLYGMLLVIIILSL